MDIRRIYSLAILIMFLLWTNPSKNDFVSWASLKAIQTGNNTLGGVGAGLSALVAGPAINAGSTRTNMYLLSAFVVDPYVGSLIQGESVQVKTLYIGIGSVFYINAGNKMTKYFDKSTGKKNGAGAQSNNVNSNSLTGSSTESCNYETSAIVKKETHYSGVCKGASNNSQSACDIRDKLVDELYAKGCCFGKEGQYGYEMSWHRCGANSLKLR